MRQLDQSRELCLERIGQESGLGFIEVDV